MRAWAESVHVVGAVRSGARHRVTAGRGDQCLGAVRRDLRCRHVSSPEVLSHQIQDELGLGALTLLTRSLCQRVLAFYPRSVYRNSRMPQHLTASDLSRLLGRPRSAKRHTISPFAMGGSLALFAAVPLRRHRRHHHLSSFSLEAVTV